MIIGGHVGLQHKFGRFLIGADAGLSCGPIITWAERRLANGRPLDSELKLRRILTVGPRVGWTPVDRWLVSIGGGYATTRIEQQVTTRATGVLQPSLHTAEEHDGWHLGGAVEYAFAPGWIIGLEYKHISFDNVQHCRQQRKAANTCLHAGDDSTSNIDAKVDAISVRLGVKLGRD